MDENEALYSRNETLQMDNLIKRYQKCADRIWALFPTDPLPDDDHAHFMIERLESILNHDLLAPKVESSQRVNECAFGDGGSAAYMSSSEIAQARRLNDMFVPLRKEQK